MSDSYDGLDFSCLARDLDSLTEEERVDFGLEQEQPQRRRGLIGSHVSRSVDGKYIDVNDGHGLHTTSRDIGFGYRHRR